MKGEKTTVDGMIYVRVSAKLTEVYINGVMEGCAAVENMMVNRTDVVYVFTLGDVT